MEIGAGVQWFDVKDGDWQRTGLRTDLGLRYARERRRGYFGEMTGPLPGEERIAPRAAVAFNWGFSQEVSLSSEAEAVVAVGDGGRLMVKAATKLSSRLSRAVTLGVGYIAHHDSDPAPGKVHWDTELATVLEVGF